MKKPLRRAACACLIALAAIAAQIPALAQDARATTVQRVARDWLAVVDRADYAESWKQAAAKFRLAMTPERWSEAAKSVRGPLGAVDQRTLVRTTFTRTFPGAPEGEYALVVFRTAFQNKTQSEETITVEQEADGQWRVVGYTVR
jgi:hypothetical protein